MSVILCTNSDGTNTSVLIIEVGVYVFLDVGVTEGHVLCFFFLCGFFASCMTCMYFYEFIEMAAYKTHINDQRDLDMYLK